MKQTRNEGCPRKKARSRMVKVQMRNPHWREIRVIDALDERGNPLEWHYVSEPLIVEHPAAKGKLFVPRKRKLLLNAPKHYLDALHRECAAILQLRSRP